VLEQFENCWEPKRYNYLLALRDSEKPADFADLRYEDNARAWIESRPDAFCNTDDAKILSQVLNNYDQETNDFYRWTVTYGKAELSALVKERSGTDFGEIIDLIPLERGTSGRIVRLKIVGTKRTMVIGKELEIRRTLSTSHLYSSAFTVEHTDDAFTLHGAGWGHGVGLCQIGAAVMGEKGYTYKQILTHYFCNAEISTIY
jgi:SpoIID/LytB domain protein